MLWNHIVRILDLSLDEVEWCKGTLLHSCLGHVCSCSFYKMVAIGPSSGRKHTAGPQKSLKTESSPFAEGDGTDLALAEKMCPWEEDKVATDMPTLPWL